MATFSPNSLQADQRRVLPKLMVCDEKDSLFWLMICRGVLRGRTFDAKAAQTKTEIPGRADSLACASGWRVWIPMCPNSFHVWMASSEQGTKNNSRYAQAGLAG